MSTIYDEGFLPEAQKRLLLFVQKREVGCLFLGSNYRVVNGYLWINQKFSISAG